MHHESTGNSQSTFVSVFTIKRPKGMSAARARGLLIVKTLNKCILSSLVSNLFLDRQSMYFCTQAKPCHAYYSCISRCEEKKITWTISCVNFAALSLLKHPSLVWSQTLNWQKMASFFRCLQMLPAMPQARQRDTDDTLTYIVYPQKRKKGCFMERRSWHLAVRVMNFGQLKLSLIVDAPEHLLF